MELLKEYFTPWIISNSIALLFLVASIRKPKLARFLFVLLFSWACWINYTTSHGSPGVYLEYATFTPFHLYKAFIKGWFKENVTLMVTAISFGQALIALGMMLSGRWVRLACMGAIIFFLAISPLGVGSGFPAPLISIVTVYFILKKDDLNYLWSKKGHAKF
ncbi:hypothetical protein [Spongiimicrobium sp. 2-473A-2-J]|uniref:hypothetical protein n=1 Tax=Eudoraea algarum TaxID=3417568 RepID=UPI003D36DAE8